MSRVGRQKVVLPEGVEAIYKDGRFSVKGKLGSLEVQVPASVKVDIKDNKVITQSVDDPSMWGTIRANIANAVKGVDEGFSKKLEIQGVGYRASLKGKTLVIEAGFSHPVETVIPDGLEVKVQKTIILITGIDKQLVGQFAFEVRRIRPPEPYKGKGIRYVDEYVIRKEGKKAAAAEGGE